MTSHCQKWLPFIAFNYLTYKYFKSYFSFGFDRVCDRLHGLTRACISDAFALNESIRNGCIRNESIRNSSVRNGKIRIGSIGNGRIRNGKKRNGSIQVYKWLLMKM